MHRQDGRCADGDFVADIDQGRGENMKKQAIPAFALEKNAAPGEREIRMRPGKSGNPFRAGGRAHE